jgi:hypothetical protein
LSTVRAVSPPPDGGYLNNNTAEGEEALFELTTGDNNTAIGFEALFNVTTGTLNTAIGECGGCCCSVVGTARVERKLGALQLGRIAELCADHVGATLRAILVSPDTKRATGALMLLYS